MLWPDQPEYLQLFSNEGPVTVRIKFLSVNDKHRSMPAQKMAWYEINKLFDPSSGEPQQYIYLDTYKCPVIRYEIEPTKHIVTLVIGETGLP